MFTYDLTDEDCELPYNAPGRSRSYFDLDGEVGMGRPNRRADAIKLETILGNSGDLDLEYVGGPTGLGSETLDQGLRAYQKRNGLTVDGWMRPGGPTITKMKAQFGGLLGDYEAPTPKQSDTHHRMRDAGYEGFLKPQRQELLLPPIPGLPKPDETIRAGNRSTVEHLGENGYLLQDMPGCLASVVRRDPKAGVVEARDFVDQIERASPGSGTQAIRVILHALADTPDLQRAFFGGPVIELAPIGVFEPDGPRRYEEALRTRPWEAVEEGKKLPGEGQIRDLAYRPDRDGPPQARPLPISAADAATARLLRYADGAGSEPPVHNDGLLDPAKWAAHLRGQSEEIAREDAGHTGSPEGPGDKAMATEKTDEDALAIQIAQARGQPQQPGANREPRQIAPPTPIPPQEPFRALFAERETRNRQDLTNTTKGTDQRPQEVLGLYQLSRDILGRKLIKGIAVSSE